MRPLTTLFTGQTFLDLPEAASTNESAILMLSKSKPAEGTVISTFHQSDGRGQIGGKWESGRGKNITLSVIFYPQFLTAHRQFLLNQAVSLAVYDAVSKNLAAPVTIKWPNDIYVGDKKIAGILIQNTIGGSFLRTSVVGIGLNVNQTEFLSNPPNPTSFRLETGRDFDLYDLIADLCECLEQRYLTLKSGNSFLLQQDYLRHLYRFQTLSFFEKNTGERFQGSITGITETGRLLINKRGEEASFDLKEIRFVVTGD